MDDIQELERRWYKYRAKKVMVVLFGFLLFGLLVGGLYYAYEASEKSVDLLTEKKAEMKRSKEASLTTAHPITAPKAETNSSDTTLQKPESMDNDDTYEVSLEPVIPIVDIEREERKKSHRASRPKSTIQSGVRAKPSTYLTAKELAAVSHELDTTNRKKINLHGSSKNYIETMKEKFAETKNSREALLLARAFYVKANYQEAEHWALTANKLDNNLAESWFIFAKSKYKLGKKDEAIQILATYYKKSHSSRAKVLIEKIKKGSL